MSFTDQKRRVATEADLKANWGGDKPGKRFRCYLCGHKFQIGDGWRWVYSAGAIVEGSDGKKWGCVNFKVCDDCDGPEVVQKWAIRNAEYHQAMSGRFWALC